MVSDKHFSFRCSTRNAFVSKIFPKLSDLFWPSLSVNGLNGLGLLAGPSGHAYMESCFEMFIVRTAILDILRPD